jgi:hypothetical protein
LRQDQGVCIKSGRTNCRILSSWRQLERWFSCPRTSFPVPGSSMNLATLCYIQL